MEEAVLFILHAAMKSRGGVSHPSRVDHAFRSARRARGVHDEERVAERKLLKLQLGQLIQLIATRRQEVVDEDAGEGSRRLLKKNIYVFSVVQNRFVHLGVLYNDDAPVGDFGEVNLLFGASIRNHHHFLQVWQAYR